MDESFGIIGGADVPTAIAVGGGIIGVFMLFYFLVIFLSFAFSIASYVLHSLGLYTIANRRGIRNAWLAWLPVGNHWVLGSIADQYQYVAKGKIKNRRKVLLALNVGVAIAYVGWFASVIGEVISGYMGGMLLGMSLGLLLFAAIWIVLCVVQFIAYYDLFHSCQPSNAVLYLVLSILVPVTQPFIIFFLRKKELGMPPRKQPASENVVEAAEAEIVEEFVEESAEETPEEIAEESIKEPETIEEPTEE